MDLMSFLDKFDVIDKADGIVGWLLTWLPIRRSHKGRKVGGWRIAPGQVTIAVDSRHTPGATVEGYLRDANIAVCGRRITSRHCHQMQVKARQGAWAEYILLARGVQFHPSHKWIDPRNLRYTENRTTPLRLWRQR